MSSSEIFVVPAFGQGHLLPCMELCKHFALSLHYKTTLVIFSSLSSSIPSTFLQTPLLQLYHIQSPPPLQPGSDPLTKMRHDRNQMALALHDLLSTRTQHPDFKSPLCAVVDVLLVMSWTADVFKKFNVPTIGFFTSGACSAAMEYATWKAAIDPTDIKPGEVHLLPGLPEEMALTVSDLKRRPGGPHGGGGGRGGGSRKVGPPNPGEKPSWLEDVEDSLALMINTCDDLERPFLDYLASEMGKSVWGVGPLLPEKYWDSAGSLLRDADIRSNRGSDIAEDDVIQWLDSKPRGSVLYVSFGSELGPTMEEYPHLADAMEEWTGPFIWVIQPGSGRPGPPRAMVGGKPDSEGDGGSYFPDGLDKKVGGRGLIIRGWAPQLLILSHPSTGGFLSHCGWNSTVEAIGRGVPFLAWPIRGDQYYDAKLVVSYHKVGYMISDDMSRLVSKDDIAKGIGRLMADQDVKKRAVLLRTKFEHGFPPNSLASLNDFKTFIHRNLD